MLYDRNIKANVVCTVSQYPEPHGASVISVFFVIISSQWHPADECVCSQMHLIIRLRRLQSILLSDLLVSFSTLRWPINQVLAGVLF